MRKEGGLASKVERSGFPVRKPSIGTKGPSRASKTTKAALENTDLPPAGISADARSGHGFGTEETGDCSQTLRTKTDAFLFYSGGGGKRETALSIIISLSFELTFRKHFAHKNGRAGAL